MQGLKQIGLKLIGIYALVEALVTFPRVAIGGSFLAAQGHVGVTPFLVLFPYGLLVVSGVVLLAHPEKAAGLIWPGGAGPDEVGVPENEGNLAFAAAGIIVFAHAIPDVVGTAASQFGETGTLSFKAMSGGLGRMLLGVFLMTSPGTVRDLRRGERTEPAARAAGAQGGQTSVRFADLVLAVAGLVMFAASLPALLPASLAALSRGGGGEGRGALLAFSGEITRAGVGLLLFLHSSRVLELLGRWQRRARETP